VLTPYLAPAGGGLEQYARNITSGLASRHGWRIVHVVARVDSGAARVENGENARIYRLPTAIRLSNTPLDPRWPAMLRRVIAGEHPDVINAHAPVPGLADCAALVSGRVPFVLTYHMGTMRKGRAGFDLAADLYERAVLPLLVRRADHVICTSEFVRQTHRCLQTPGPPPCTIIPPGVDIAAFPAKDWPRPPRLIFVGDLSQGASYKGLPDLLAAFARVVPRHPHAELVIAGDGDARTELTERVRALGLADRVRFGGQLDQGALAGEYAAARALVHPTHLDNLPLVVLEAMSSGVPVVATRVGAIPEAVTDGETGYLFEPGDVAALAGHIDAILGAPDSARRMGEAARARIEARYGWGDRVDTTNSVLEEVIGLPRRASTSRISSRWRRRWSSTE
jgi:phosphatidylinositol alpha-mannosyltransferase